MSHNIVPRQSICVAVVSDARIKIMRSPRPAEAENRKDTN